MWRRQILHVWVKNKEAGNIVYKVIKELPDEEVSDILVVISIAKSSDFIFTNKINDRYPPEVQHLKEILKFLEKDSPAGIFLSEHIKCLLKRKNWMTLKNIILDFFWWIFLKCSRLYMTFFNFQFYFEKKIMFFKLLFQPVIYFFFLIVCLHFSNLVYCDFLIKFKVFSISCLLLSDLSLTGA